MKNAGQIVRPAMIRATSKLEASGAPCTHLRCPEHRCELAMRRNAESFEGDIWVED